MTAAAERAAPAADGGGEGCEWEVLRRVQGAEVTWTATGPVDRGRNRRPGPVTGERAAALGRLLAGRLVVLEPPDPGGHQLVSTTVAGEIRYAELFGRGAW